MRRAMSANSESRETSKSCALADCGLAGFRPRPGMTRGDLPAKSRPQAAFRVPAISLTSLEPPEKAERRPGEVVMARRLALAALIGACALMPNAALAQSARAETI